MVLITVLKVLILISGIGIDKCKQYSSLLIIIIIYYKVTSYFYSVAETGLFKLLHTEGDKTFISLNDYRHRTVSILTAHCTSLMGLP